jgi:hypothetical protein
MMPGFWELVAFAAFIGALAIGWTIKDKISERRKK